MVSTEGETKKRQIVRSRAKKMRRSIVFVSIAFITLSAMSYGGYVMYRTGVDKRVEVAQSSAKQKIEATVDNYKLGGKFFVEYSTAIARGDSKGARLVYISDGDSTGMQSLNCTWLFFAAVELNVEADVVYAGDCIERVGATYENAYRIAALYKERGDADNARRFAEVASKSLNPNSESIKSNLDALKEFGYEG